MSKTVCFETWCDTGKFLIGLPVSEKLAEKLEIDVYRITIVVSKGTAGYVVVMANDAGKGQYNEVQFDDKEGCDFDLDDDGIQGEITVRIRGGHIECDIVYREV